MKLRTVLLAAGCLLVSATASAQVYYDQRGVPSPYPYGYSQPAQPQPYFVPNPSYNLEPRRQWVPNYGAPGMPEVGGGLAVPRNGIGGGYSAPNYGDDEQ